MNYPQELHNRQQGQQAVTPLSQNVSNSADNYQQHMFYYTQKQLHIQHNPSQTILNQYVDTTRYVKNHTAPTSITNNKNSNGGSIKNNNSSPNNIHENDIISINNTINGTENSFISGRLVKNPLLNEDDSTLLSHMNLNQLPTNPSHTNSNVLLEEVPISQTNSRPSDDSNNNKNDGKGLNNNYITHLKNGNITNIPSDISNSNLSNHDSGNHGTINNCNIKNEFDSPNMHNILPLDVNIDISSHSATTISNEGTLEPPYTNKHEFDKDHNSHEVPKYTNNTYYNSMNKSSHVINNPSIQESLSPYFPPFGVDVSYLAMTNPRIYQTSFPLYDEPFGRRRISISNGQISQLGEDLETVENLYNKQPPPMPLKDGISATHPAMDNNVGKQRVSSQTTHALYSNPLNTSSPNLIHRNGPSPQQPLSIQIQSPPHQKGWPQDVLAGNILHPNTKQPQYTSFVAQEQSVSSHIQSNEIKPISTPALMIHQQLSARFNQQSPQLQVQPHVDQQQATLLQRNVLDITNNNIKNNIKTTAGSPYGKKAADTSSNSLNDSLGQSTQSSDVNSPSTEAWKRVRLLERNRIAASKCRKRKKMAQLQLQKDFDNLVKENKVIKKKLKHYENLITKFRKLLKARLEDFYKSDVSNNLQIIEDMLKIEEDIHEFDDSSSVVGLANLSSV